VYTPYFKYQVFPFRKGYFEKVVPCERKRWVYRLVSDNNDNMIKLQIEIIKLVNVKFSNWICKLMFSEFEK